MLSIGVDEATSLTHDVERVNEAIYARNRGRPFSTVRAELRAGHGELVALLERLSLETLLKPYERFLPQEPSDDSEAAPAPVLNGVIENTCGHVEEHLPWIRALLNGS